MKHVKKSVLLWYSAREMYALVTAVAAYPAFLPWCERAEVLDEDGQGMTARLHLQFAGLHHAFTTRNTHEPDRAVVMEKGRIVMAGASDTLAADTAGLSQTLGV